MLTQKFWIFFGVYICFGPLKCGVSKKSTQALPMPTFLLQNHFLLSKCGCFQKTCSVITLLNFMWVNIALWFSICSFQWKHFFSPIRVILYTFLPPNAALINGENYKLNRLKEIQLSPIQVFEFLKSDQWFKSYSYSYSHCPPNWTIVHWYWGYFELSLVLSFTKEC